MQHEHHQHHRFPQRGRQLLIGLGVITLFALVAALAASSGKGKPLVIAAPSPTLATARCFGYTAQLTLIQGHASTPPATATTVASGTQWQLTITGPVTRTGDAVVTASLDTFIIRAEQAMRHDLTLIRWSGAATSLTAQGDLLLPRFADTIRAGDHGRILAWIQTPIGSFGVQGFTFALQPTGDNFTITNPTPLSQEQCPLPTPPTALPRPQ